MDKKTETEKTCSTNVSGVAQYVLERQQTNCILTVYVSVIRK